jgi:hypothetical protein
MQANPTSVFTTRSKESMMQKLLFVACMSLFSIPAMASCDKLKDEIDAKLQAKGIKSYTLEVQPIQGAAKAQAVAAASAVPAASTSAGKVVGTCDGGTKQIIYTRS